MADEDADETHRHLKELSFTTPSAQPLIETGIEKLPNRFEPTQQ